MLEMPYAYIQPGNDRLISRSHGEEIRAIAPQLRVREIPGPLFRKVGMVQQRGMILRPLGIIMRP